MSANPPDKSQLIEWKTNAWKDPGMVARYSGYMVMNRATNRLKNRLEVDACVAHARGERILDVGVGTGRGALPLAALGRQVTGVDISQAMLDECQRLAQEQGIRMTTQQSPLDQLPFAAASFDSLISLNVIMHFPNWKEILPEWVRVVRPGGRLIFDVHSLDHYRAALGRQVTEEELLAAEQSTYVLRITAADLVAEADRLGLAVVALIPYGAFLGGGNRNYLLDALESQFSWVRLLSWMAADEALFALALFLEQELIARLTTTVTGRFMAVLEKKEAREGNRAWLERNRLLDGYLRQVPVALEPLAAALGTSLEQWRSQLGVHLAASLRCRRFFFALTERLIAEQRVQWRDLLAPPLDSYFSAYTEKFAEDRLVSAWSQQAGSAAKSLTPALQSDGIDVGSALEYFLIEPFLTCGMGRFTGVRW